MRSAAPALYRFARNAHEPLASCLSLPSVQPLSGLAARAMEAHPPPGPGDGGRQSRQGEMALPGAAPSRRK
ncbi:hypothetical protein DVDV_4152 [Desulfovibrio sp. DV]|nr:hypothetical protein DVDV_4152 [Desulfovibrio sp. DV]